MYNIKGNDNEMEVAGIAGESAPIKGRESGGPDKSL